MLPTPRQQQAITTLVQDVMPTMLPMAPAFSRIVSLATSEVNVDAVRLDVFDTWYTYQLTTPYGTFYMAYATDTHEVKFSLDHITH